MLNDLYQVFGSDLSPSNSGDLLSVNGLEMGKQRVLRRLLTNPGDYIFHPEYGAGLPQYIGAVMDIPKITSVIKGQMKLEACVSQNPPPTINISQITNGISVSISYIDSGTQQAVYLDFPVVSTAA
jgi:hypothetical protein